MQDVCDLRGAMQAHESKSHSKSSSPTPWWYTTELQSLRKLVEEQKQELKETSSTLCGLQWRMAQMTSLAQRVEALESGHVSLSGGENSGDLPLSSKSGWGNEALGRLTVLEVSVKDLEACFELYKNNCTAQAATSMAVLDTLQKQGCRDLVPLEDSRKACSAIGSSHEMDLERLREKLKAPSNAPGELEDIIRDASTPDLLRLCSSLKMLSVKTENEIGTATKQETCGAFGVSVASTPVRPRPPAISAEPLSSPCRNPPKQIVDPVVLSPPVFGGYFTVASANTPITSEAVCREEDSSCSNCKLQKKMTTPMASPVNTAVHRFSSSGRLSKSARRVTPCRGRPDRDYYFPRCPVPSNTWR